MRPFDDWYDAVLEQLDTPKRSHRGEKGLNVRRVNAG